METLALGLIFLGTGNFIDRPSAAPTFIATVDDPPFAIALIIIGLYVMFSCLGVLTKSVKDIIVFLLLFVWTFYLIIFAIHDFNAPVLMPKFTTIFILFIDIRILFEAFWSEP
ncbi:hypothetical protein [Companilactobacillus bobalius]|uniref:Uncharacterized protein n=1 Tax=Companilactobacillus bobalius DSM 19674 TaxID=1423788 RepID=A0A0R1KJE8_9LACO|nr:hypothetical protein [Companilactobacillus bobalius]KRK83477.1 hypothetical protein FC78_GL001433 [Companilactobacillus bobalius DSM 19674]